MTWSDILRIAGGVEPETDRERAFVDLCIIGRLFLVVKWKPVSAVAPSPTAPCCGFSCIAGSTQFITQLRYSERQGEIVRIVDSVSDERSRVL